MIAAVPNENATPPDLRPDEPRATPYGLIYPPRSIARTLAAFFGSGIGGALFGFLLSELVGATTDAGRIVCLAPFPLVLGLGYSLWVARLQALFMEGLGRSLMRATWRLVRFRQLPEDMNEVLPNEEQLTKLAVRAQKAASSFVVVAVPIGALFGLLAAFVTSGLARLGSPPLLAGACLAYGALLYRLGRRGYLPMGESEGE